MSNAVELSNVLAAAVDRAAPSVVRVDARRRGPAAGVVYGDGQVVTAHHVVEWDEGIEVILADGARVAATLVGRDPTTDLALLKVAASGLAAAGWADSSGLRVGHLVLAVSRGSQGPRAGHGIVSAIGGAWRTMAGGLVDAYLETDVALFAGYSGSLLVDAAGVALGLNTAGLVRGAGVALPAATLRRVVDTLAAHGHVRRGYLGIGTMPVRLDPEPAAALGQDAGLMITSVQAGTPAAQAGLMMGDVLLALDGAALQRPRDLLARLDEQAVGRQVTLRVLRAGQPREVALTVGSRDRSAA